MKRSFFNTDCSAFVYFVFFSLMACSTSPDKNPSQMKDNNTKGSYGFDVGFFTKHNIKFIELKDPGSKASVLLIPAYQGRVMTSTSAGNDGPSFGWINYAYIESGEKSKQFNPYGGEERFWLGPEGGPFSIFFKGGAEQIFSNWVVPEELDTLTYDLVSGTPESAFFRKNFKLSNSSGTEMNIGIERRVSILNREKVEKAFNLRMDDSLTFVAFESENTLINRGENTWTDKTGFLSIWMLSMFNSSEKGVVFIPFKKGGEKELGKMVNDDYFGKVPSDRLLVMDGIMFFKVDGKFRSKIGISPQRALSSCGSYSPETRTLSLLFYSAPEKPSHYVNSKWGDQSDPLMGDVVNSYNDGPLEDGSIMGPFYEIESSSPAALLSSGERITHTQTIFHITGSEEKLSIITERLFNQPISGIKKAFN